MPPPRLARVTPLADYAHRRNERLAAAERAAAHSQEIFARLLSKAYATRQRDFRHAIEAGASLEALANATGLETEELVAIIGAPYA
jgi:hypothetical protein